MISHQPLTHNSQPTKKSPNLRYCRLTAIVLVLDRYVQGLQRFNPSPPSIANVHHTDMKKVIFFAAILTLMLSCKKKNMPAPELLGTISGRIAPVGVFTSIQAINASGESLNTQVAANDGSFNFNQLRPGKYTIQFPSDPRFQSMANMQVEVISGKSTDMGTISYQAVSQLNGGISGKLLPQGFGEQVIATNVTTKQQYVFTLSSTNANFMLTLPNGEYHISFKAVKPAEAPADVNITVTGNLVDMGDFFCKQGTAGQILAKVDPVGSVSTARVTNVQTGQVVTGIVNRIEGTISFPVLAEGNYKLVLVALAPYLSIEKDVAVKATAQTDLGTITMQQDANVRKLGYTIDGKKTLRYNLSATFNGGTLSFSNTNTKLISGMLNRQSYDYNTLSVAVGNITGPGVYTVNGANNTKISYREYRTGGMGYVTTGIWAASSSGAGGKLEILSIDQVARRIKGTFSGTLDNTTTSPLSTKKTLTLTEGEFYLDY